MTVAISGVSSCLDALFSFVIDLQISVSEPSVKFSTVSPSLVSE